MRSCLRAMSFLTRCPAPGFAFAGGPHPLGGDAAMFPLVGVVVALPSCILLLALSSGDMTPLVSATAAILLLVALTGALHEDGLADSADALFGSAGRERALDIMKDSRIGTYGALALIGSLCFRIALTTELAVRSPWWASASLMGAAAASRGAMAWTWSSLPSARPDGLASQLGNPNPRIGILATALSLAAIGIAGGLTSGWLGVLFPLLFGMAATLGIRAIAKRRLGGHTGDTLGATQQASEIALLFGFALAAAQGG